MPTIRDMFKAVDEEYAPPEEQPVSIRGMFQQLDREGLPPEQVTAREEEAATPPGGKTIRDMFLEKQASIKASQAGQFDKELWVEGIANDLRKGGWKIGYDPFGGTDLPGDVEYYREVKSRALLKGRRWLAEHGLPTNLMNSKRVQAQLGGYFARVELLQAARPSPDDINPGDQYKVADSTWQQFFQSAKVTQQAFNLISQADPWVRHSLITWLEAPELDIAQVPEELRPYLHGLFSGLTKESEYPDTALANRMAWDQIRGKIKQSHHDSLNGLILARRMEKAGLMAEGMADRIPAGRLPEFARLELDPALVSPHMDFVQELGGTESLARQAPGMEPDQRLLAFGRYLNRMREEAEARRQASGKDDYRDAVAMFWEPVGQAMQHAFRPIRGGDEYQFSSNFLTQFWTQFRRRIDQTQQLFLSDTERAQLEEVRSLGLMGADLADEERAILSWQALFNKTVEDSGVRDWLHEHVGDLAVWTWDALQQELIEPSLFFVEGEPEGTTMLFGMAYGGAVAKHIEANPPEWLMRRMVARAKKPANHAMARALIDNTSQMPRRTAQTLIRKAKARAIRGADRVWAEAYRRLEDVQNKAGSWWGKIVHGGSILRAQADVARAKALQRAAAVAKALPGDFGDVIGVLDHISPHEAALAFDPTGTKAGGMFAAVGLKNLPRAARLEILGKQEGWFNAVRRQASGTPDPTKPRAALASGAPGSELWAELADYGYDTAAQQKKVQVAFDAAREGYRMERDLLRQEARALREAGDIPGAEAAERAAVERGKKLRALSMENERFWETMKDDRAKAAGWRPEKTLEEAISREVAEALADVDPAMGVVLERARATARKKVLSAKRGSAELRRAARDTQRQYASLRSRLERARDRLRRSDPVAVTRAQHEALSLEEQIVDAERRLGGLQNEVGNRAQILHLMEAGRGDYLPVNPPAELKKTLSVAEKNLRAARREASKVETELRRLRQKHASATRNVERMQVRVAKRRALEIEVEDLERATKAGRQDAEAAARVLRGDQLQAADEAWLAAQEPYQRQLAKGLRENFTVEPAPDAIRAVIENTAEELNRIRAARPTAALPTPELPTGRGFWNMWRRSNAAARAFKEGLHERAWLMSRFKRILQSDALRAKVPGMIDALEEVLSKRGLDPDDMARRLDDVVQTHMPELLEHRTAAKEMLRAYSDLESELLVRANNLGGMGGAQIEELFDFWKPYLYEGVPGAKKGGAPKAVGAMAARADDFTYQHVLNGDGPQFLAEGTSDWQVFYEARKRRPGERRAPLKRRYVSSREDAKAWISDRFGDDAARNAFGEGKGRRVAFVVPPKDVQDAVIEGMERSQVVTRIEKLQSLIEMVSRLQTLEQFRQLTGGVVSPKRARAMSRELLDADFVRLPNHTAYGNLAGHYAHKDIVATMGRWSGWEKYMKGVFDGILEDGFGMGFGTRVARSLGTVSGSKVYNGIRRAALSSWIWLNHKTWIANNLFNVTCGLIGMDIAPWQVLSKDFREGVMKMRAQDPDFMELTRYGVDLERGAIAADIRSNNTLADAWRAKFQGGRAQRAADRVRRLRAIDPAAVRDPMKLQRAISAAEREAGRNFIKDSLGFLRKVSDVGFSLYGAVDLEYRAGFANILLKRGLDKGRVAEMLRKFMQNYSEVPPGVRSIATMPVLGSMVTSFPYEWARINFNMLRHRNLQVLGALGAIWAFNTASLGAQGRTYEQWARENHFGSSLQGVVDASSNLAMPGGWNIPLDDATGMNTLTMSGGKLRASANNFAEEGDAVSSLIAMGLTGASRLFLNNIVIGGIDALSGIDTFTQKRLTDDSASAYEKLNAKLKWVVKNFTPPLLGGYQAEQMAKHYDLQAGRHVPAWERALSTVGVRRNLPAHGISNIVSEANKKVYKLNEHDLPLYGTNREILQALMDFYGADEEGSREALKELLQKLQEPITRTIAGKREAVYRPRRGVLQSLQRYAMLYPERGFVGLPVYAKAWALRRAYEAGYHEREPELYRRLVAIALYGKDGAPPKQARQMVLQLLGGKAPSRLENAMKWQSEPEALQKALEELAPDGRMPGEPGLQTVFHAVILRLAELRKKKK